MTYKLHENIMDIFKLYILDKTISKLIKHKKVDKAQWNIKEVKSDRDFPQYQFSITIRNKNYYISSPSYQNTFQLYVKKYSLKAIENIIAENEPLFSNIDFNVKIKVKHLDNQEIVHSFLHART